MPDWSRGRGQTKNSPWPSRLGARRWANHHKVDYRNLKHSKATLPWGQRGTLLGEATNDALEPKPRGGSGALAEQTTSDPKNSD